MINDDSSELFSLKSNEMTIARIIEYLYNIKKYVNAADYFSNAIVDTLFKGDKVENV